ncbi:hypothetical protein OAS14_00880 [Alphaproteobacteria bacterium]|nr:hypothetical protein [Alphaproteobacteria bacterium]
MQDKRDIRADKFRLFLFVLLSIATATWIALSIDLRRIVDTEIQGIQRHMTSFSSAVQLFDDGRSGVSDNIRFDGILPGLKNFWHVLLAGNSRNSVSKAIELDIKFKNLQKIYADREEAILKTVNENPTKVPCRISDGEVTYKCQVRLKGDLRDHWNAEPRLSLRIKVKGGYIHGLKNFSIQKPRARQFPYDQVFHDLNSKLGGLSSNRQQFVNFRLNGQPMGIMNVEPTINSQYVESLEIKRFGIFKISNEESWAYHKTEDSYAGFFVSDPTINFVQRGTSRDLEGSEKIREIHSIIANYLYLQPSKLFDRQKMVESLIWGLVWGNLHAHDHSNSRYTWNDYTQKLEPILADQGRWKSFDASSIYQLPFGYRDLIIDKPISHYELENALQKIRRVISLQDPIDLSNSLKSAYFQNDRRFSHSPIKENLRFIADRQSWVLNFINNLAKEHRSYHAESVTLSKANIEGMRDFVYVLHHTDGSIRIFNLIDQPVRISKVTLNEKTLNVDREIPGSKPKRLASIVVRSSFLDFQDFKINVHAEKFGVTKVSSNKNTIFPLHILNPEQKAETLSSLCSAEGADEKCVISGEANLRVSQVFDRPVRIEPGTKITLGAGVDLIFKSSVEMLGQAGEEISLKGNGSSIIIVNKGFQKSTINHVNFSGLSEPASRLRRYTGAINGYGGEFGIKAVSINNSLAEDQLNLVHAKITVDGLSIDGAKSDGFDCDFCTGEILSADFKNIGGDGLDVSGSEISVGQISFSNIDDKAISVGENSDVTVKFADVARSGTGIAVKDASRATVKLLQVSAITHDAVMTYVKKPFYLGATTVDVQKFTGKDEVGGNVCISQTGTHAQVFASNCETTDLDVDSLYAGRMKK